MPRLRNKKLVNELAKHPLAVLSPRSAGGRTGGIAASGEGSCSPGAAPAVGAELCAGCEWSSGPWGAASPQGRHLVALVLRIAASELLWAQVELVVL